MPQVMTIASTFESMYTANHSHLDIIESYIQQCELPYTRTPNYIAFYAEVPESLRKVAYLDGRIELTLNTMRHHD
jgi:hypothetical protein